MSVCFGLFFFLFLSLFMRMKYLRTFRSSDTTILYPVARVPPSFRFGGSTEPVFVRDSKNYLASFHKFKINPMMP